LNGGLLAFISDEQLISLSSVKQFSYCHYKCFRFVSCIIMSSCAVDLVGFFRLEHLLAEALLTSTWVANLKSRIPLTRSVICSLYVHMYVDRYHYGVFLISSQKHIDCNS